jgi:hypothetical protein
VAESTGFLVVAIDFGRVLQAACETATPQHAAKGPGMVLLFLHPTRARAALPRRW